MDQVGSEFKGLDREQQGKVADIIATAVKASFRFDGNPNPKGTEIRRRFTICCKWFGVMRKELGWSIPRIRAEMVRALRTELEGGFYTPSGRGSFAS